MAWDDGCEVDRGVGERCQDEELGGGEEVRAKRILSRVVNGEGVEGKGRGRWR